MLKLPPPKWFVSDIMSRSSFPAAEVMSAFNAILPVAFSVSVASPPDVFVMLSCTVKL